MHKNFNLLHAVSSFIIFLSQFKFPLRGIYYITYIERGGESKESKFSIITLII
jgi:hypothetical protein